ncbi:membrane hypothetical protein [[Clostridium] ultunense Esp]|nr:membrane hypothetical protein [[Clostridium] ultunense Esp]
MDQLLKLPPLNVDFRMMGWAFPLPIVVSILMALFHYAIHGGSENLIPIEAIRYGLGFFSVPFISVWAIHLYQNLVNPEEKEVLLSLPYQPFSFGLLRLLRITLIYLIFFWSVQIFLYSHSREGAAVLDWVFPVVLIFYFSSLSYFIVLAVKNVLIGYALLGIYIVFEYTTRGGFSGPFYAFQWVNPKPTLESGYNLLALILLTLAFLLIAQWILTNRDLLSR